MNNYTPLVTIIIPVYNGSNFLAEAINSALEQTYKNIEIIVVNDGSNDNGKTEMIARSYGEKIIYYEKKNAGVSSALNYALERMNGEWFSWLSHDDLYYPKKIEIQVDFLNKLLKDNPKLNLNKIVLHSATVSIDKNGKIIKRPKYSDLNIKENFLDIVVGNIYNYRLSGCSFLLPKFCYEELGGFREDIRTVSDVEFWYRLAFNGYQFYCLKNDILVKNRSHGKQVGKMKVLLFEEEINKLFIEIIDRFYENSKYNEINNLLKIYYGLKKRGCEQAAEYIKVRYLKNNMSKAKYNINVSIKVLYYIISGRLRNILRYIYRKIKVK